MRRNSHGARPAALVALLTLAVSLLAPAGVAHGGAIEAQELREQSEDPTEITFSLRVNAPAGLESATLIYKVLNPDGNVGGIGAGTFAPGAETDVTFMLETRGAQRYIPVGSILVYHWELVDREGDSLDTREREFVFLDGRYNWRQKTEGETTVFWYGNNENNALAAFGAARDSLASTGALLETEVPYPVRIIVYHSDAAGEMARRPRGSIFEEQILTGGQRVAPDLVLVFAADLDIVRHEIAHIVTHVAGDGPFTSLPSWVDEGVAVYVQTRPGLRYTEALEAGVNTDTTLSLRSMQSTSNRVEQVNLFYGQSFGTVEFLIDEFGRERLAELFRVHFEGSAMDEALLEVYGFDQNGLYNAWREAQGLQPLALATPASASYTPQLEATRAPLGIPTPAAAAAAASPPEENRESDGTADLEAPVAGAPESGSGSAAGLAVGAGTLLVVILLGGGALMLLRRGRGEAASQ